MITEAKIVALAGKPALVSEVNLPKAPGQHLLHYSPHTPLQLFNDRAQLIDACKTLTQQNLECAALLMAEDDLPDCKVIQLPKLLQVASHLVFAQRSSLFIQPRGLDQLHLRKEPRIR